MARRGRLERRVRSAETRKETRVRGSSTNAGGGFGGATPKAAFAEFARALQRREAFRAPPAARGFPTPRALFGFRHAPSQTRSRSTPPPRAAPSPGCARRAASAWRRSAVDALDREFDPDSSNRLEKSRVRRGVALFRGAFAPPRVPRDVRAVRRHRGGV